MNVAFASNALDDERSHRFLDGIFWLMVDGRHGWVVPDVDVLLGSTWVTAQAPRLRRRIKELAETCARRTSVQVDLAVARNPDGDAAGPTWTLTPRAAYEYLQRPVVLIVENARCDGAFVRQVFLRVGEKMARRRLGDDVFDELRASWQSPLGDGVRVSIRHGGGGTTADQVELSAEASPTTRPRLIVVVDSDSPSAGAAHGATATRVQASCLAASATYSGRWRVVPFVLRKREVENYIPHDALRKRFGRAQVDRALSTGDADYLDLKQLVGGHLWRVMLDPSMDVHLHAKAWRDRAGSKELDELVSAILSEL